MVKAQIHAGGRGKAGGVKVVKGAEAARAAAEKILGMTLVTPQTGPGGKMVKRLLVEQGVSIARELYAGMLVDRGTGRIVVMASTEGGMEIEEVAAHSPEKILKEIVDPAVGLAGYQARNLAYGLGLTGDAAKNGASFLLQAVPGVHRRRLRAGRDQPAGRHQDGEVIALDCKMNFDDNALYRHRDLEELRDLEEEEPAEIEAKKYDLSFIKLDGNIGCMVNGAGLAMATMDIIKHFGGEPANFLDVGGGATKEKVTAAFKIITSRSGGEGHLRQHLRRHHEVRHHRRRRDRGGQGSGAQGAAGGAARRHQRGAGQEAPGGIRPGGHRGNDMADGAQKIVALSNGKSV